jgi:hypothetical protein
MTDATCLHCEKQPPCNTLGLCQGCYDVSGIRTLYVPRKHQTPELLERLMLYRRRAERGEPLFQGEGKPLVKRRRKAQPKRPTSS